MTSLQHQDWLAGSLTDDQLIQVAELHLAAFDPKGRTVEDYIEQRLRTLWQLGEDDSDGKVVATAKLHVIVSDGQLIAKAATFLRTIGTQRGKRDVMALAGVAAHPDARGGGWGKRIVRAAFERIDRGDFTDSLFQTGEARRFYERLGCRVVENPFCNSRGEDPTANPWSDGYSMIYPGDSEWPDGPIDLMGPCY